MEPVEFADRWNDYMVRTGLTPKFSLYRLPKPDTRLSLTASDFLVTAGLPSAAGLSFSQLLNELERVSEVYNRGQGWSADDRERLQPYLLLGNDDGANPICLNTANQERIIFLNHERNLAIAEFVNSGVAQMAQCILVYQELVEKYQNEYGEEAELYEGSVPSNLVEQTFERFRLIDSACVEGHCYWLRTLEDI